MMTWALRAVMWVLPLLLRFIDKHSDDWFMGIYKYIEKLMGKKYIETTLVFVDKYGNPLYNVRLEFMDDTHGLVSYLATEDGSIVMQGFRKEDVDVTFYIQDGRQVKSTIKIGDNTLQRIVL